MRTLNLRHFLFSTFFLCASIGFAQNSCTLESYYSSEEIFRIDSVYEKVNIDGQTFTIKVLYDKKNEHLEDVGELDEYAFSSDSPITLVFYKNEKIIYAKKFGYDLPRIFKAGNDLTVGGKLYLGWFSSGGGSGYSVETYLVSLRDNQIVMDDVMETNELSYTIYNKNDNEIYLLQGIWGYNGEDTDSEEFETHFSDHKYEIFVYSYDSDGFGVDSKGVTKNKYTSEWDDSKDLLREIFRKETFLPYEININDFY
jgi:hypothetical protein